MNILIVNHYAGSTKMGMEYRPYYLAKEWIQKGHSVSIIAASYSHVRSVQPAVKNKLTLEEIEGIKYYWIKTPGYSGNSAGRIINIFAFVNYLWRKARYFANIINPDVVIASSTYPFDNFAVNKIAVAANAKHVYEIHDLWPLSPQELGGYSKYNLFIMLLQAAENYAYRNCDSVISILPKTLDHSIKHGLDPQKWNYVPNGINVEEWDNSSALPEKHNEILSELKTKGFKIIGYVGTHGLANALDYLVEASKLVPEDNIVFVFVGKGNQKNNLIEKAKGSRNIIFLDPVPKGCVPVLLKYFDILYIGWTKNPIYRFGISPNKIFDYMMSGKPIIHSVEAGNDIVEDSQCGISVKPENPQEIADAITNLLGMPESELIEMGRHGKDFVLKYHNYSVLAVSFLNKILQ